MNIAYRFVSVFLAANDAGETPLDLARRLRHSKCEELVSVVFILVFCFLEISY